MKQLALTCVLAMPFLGACDRFEAVGKKLDELDAAKKESTQEADGKAIAGETQHSGPAVQDIGEADFQTFITQPGRLNIVDFHADWCGPCKQLGPVLSGVIEEKSGVARLGKINVDSARQLAQEQGVRSIPDVRFYIDGKLVHKFTGGIPKEAIEDLITTHSASLRAEGMAASDGAPGSIPPPPRPPGAKPIEEAMTPMEKDWLPPGMRPK